MNYEELLDDVIEIEERLTIITGFVDVKYSNWTDALGYPQKSLSIDNFNKDSYWILLGRGTDEMIIESIMNCDINVDREGEYRFWAVLKYNSADYHEYRMVSPEYLDCEYMRWEFIQSFEQRDRQVKLDALLNDEFEDLFKI